MATITSLLISQVIPKSLAKKLSSTTNEASDLMNQIRLVSPAYLFFPSELAQILVPSLLPFWIILADQSNRSLKDKVERLMI